jgi:hypothetical protein
MSQTKYLYMTQCIDSLRILVKEKIQLLKTNKYLANADWIFIEKNFQIENPYTKNMIKEKLPNEFNQKQYNDLFEETRIRIINIQKVRMII